MMKRAQAAMEFLMTYGWAILVVLAAIGALAYFGVLNPGNLLPEKTTFKAPFIATETAVITKTSATNINIKIPFTNGQGSTIRIVANSGDADSDCTPAVNGFNVVGNLPATTVTIPNGNEFQLSWNCTMAADEMSEGDKFKTNLAFDYMTSSDLVRGHSGEVVGKIQG